MLSSYVLWCMQCSLQNCDKEIIFYTIFFMPFFMKKYYRRIVASLNQRHSFPLCFNDWLFESLLEFMRNYFKPEINFKHVVISERAKIFGKWKARVESTGKRSWNEEHCTFSRRYVISDLRRCQVKMNSYASVDTRAFTYRVRNAIKVFFLVPASNQLPQKNCAIKKLKFVQKPIKKIAVLFRCNYTSRWSSRYFYFPLIHRHVNEVKKIINPLDSFECKQ